MVEIRDAIQYFDSPKYLRLWAGEARKQKADTRVFLYETWHRLDDKDGWLNRLDRDLGKYWEGELLSKGLAHGDTGGPVHVIPAGQVLAKFVRQIEARHRSQAFGRVRTSSHANRMGHKTTST